jgi:hypothetical protein
MIEVDSDSSFDISNSIFEENLSQTGSSVMDIKGSVNLVDIKASSITSTTFRKNKSVEGGNAISSTFGSLSITNCVFDSNEAFKSS